MNQKVSWDGGYLIVRPATVKDELAAEIISIQLRQGYPDGAYGYWDTFAELCSQTVESQGLPFQPEHVRNMDIAQQRQAYDQFMEQPKALRKKWKQALAAADEVLDYDLGPVPLGENANPKA